MSMSFYFRLFIDMIELDVEAQKIHLCVSDAEIDERLRNWKPIPIPPHYQRGYAKLCIYHLKRSNILLICQDMDHVMQSHEGADLDFLVGKSGTFPLRESH
jgi:L-arabonate dehydrase